MRSGRHLPGSPGGRVAVVVGSVRYKYIQKEETSTWMPAMTATTRIATTMVAWNAGASGPSHRARSGSISLSDRGEERRRAVTRGGWLLIRPHGSSSLEMTVLTSARRVRNGSISLSGEERRLLKRRVSSSLEHRTSAHRAARFHPLHRSYYRTRMISNPLQAIIIGPCDH